jgi:hypothetical protein
MGADEGFAPIFFVAASFDRVLCRPAVNGRYCHPSGKPSPALLHASNHCYDDTNSKLSPTLLYHLVDPQGMTFSLC